MMGWTGCPMSCQSASQPGAGPCCPEAPACIPGLPDSRTPQAVPSLPTLPPHRQVSAPAPACMFSLVAGAWSLALWVQKALLSCLLGPVEGLPGQGPLQQGGSRDLNLISFFFCFRCTLGARFGGRRVRAPGGAMMWNWILSNKFDVVCTQCCL